MGLNAPLHQVMVFLWLTQVPHSDFFRRLILNSGTVIYHKLAIYTRDGLIDNRIVKETVCGLKSPSSNSSQSYKWA